MAHWSVNRPLIHQAHLTASIRIVPEQGVAKRREVDPYLVCAARLRTDFHKSRRLPETLHHHNLGDGLFKTNSASSSNRTSRGIASPAISRGAAFGTSQAISSPGLILSEALAGFPFTVTAPFSIKR